MSIEVTSSEISRLQEGPLSLKESARAFSKAKADDAFRTRLQEAIGTADFDTFLTNNIEAKIRIRLNEVPQIGPSIARIETSTKQAETVLSADELAGTFTSVEEGEEYPTAGYGKTETTITTAKYGEIIEITEEMIYFDRTGELNRNIEKLARKAARTKDELILTALIDGDNLTSASAGTYTTTRGNRGTTALDESALQARITAFRKRTDAAGNAIDVSPNLLIVTPENEVTARKLLTSVELFRDDGAGGVDGYRNVIPDMLEGGSLVVSARLGEILGDYNASYDTKTWFLARAQEGIVYYEVWPIQVFSQQSDEAGDAGFRRDVFRYKVRFYGGAGVDVPEMLDGNFVSE